MHEGDTNHTRLGKRASRGCSRAAQQEKWHVPTGSYLSGQRRSYPPIIPHEVKLGKPKLRNCVGEGEWWVLVGNSTKRYSTTPATISTPPAASVLPLAPRPARAAQWRRHAAVFRAV